MSQDRYTRRILEHLADQRYRPRQEQDLARDLGVKSEEFNDFQRSVRALLADGKVVLGVAETIGLPPVGKEMSGIFRLNDRGFGFLTPDSPVEHGDLFVPAGKTLGAMTGDRVLAKVVHEGDRGGAGRSPYTGVIVEITQRADKRYTGNLTKRGSQFVVEVDGRVLRQPVVIRDPYAKNAKLGDKVVVELIEYPSEQSPAEGVITEVLGEQGEPEVETLAVMRSYGLPDKFSPEVLEVARAAAKTYEDKKIPADREDLTQEFIITVDPPDAKDYDDAISIRRIGPGADSGFNPHAGGPIEGVDDSADSLAHDASSPRPRGVRALNPAAAWELGVHIADVSFFVKQGTALDAEAKKRGNSTYLPRKVVPMLPELLSNGVCSLQEGVNRYCKTAFIQYDALGNPLGARFANTVIHSAKRLTYIEAQALIDSDLREARRHAKTEPKYSTKLVKTLQLMNELAKTIEKRRLSEGMIVLGLPEVELIFDDSGRVVGAAPEDNAYTHKMIEMFMVEANEAAARLFHGYEIPMIRRIHPDPDAHDISELKQFARVAGYNIPSRPSRKELQGLLDAVRGKPAQHAVHIAVLRTLSRAEYSPLEIGHFALASVHYTHFTSPIRRYADLIVHRGLDAYVEAKRDAIEGKRSHAIGERGEDARSPSKRTVAAAMAADPRCPSFEELSKEGKHMSATERNSQSAERELRTYLVLDLLSEKLGEDFAATVTGVTGSGVFMQIDHYLVDGFVKITDLPGQSADRWRINQNTGALVAQRSGKTITIGDRFTVRIARVEPVTRQMDLVIITEENARKKLPGTPGGPALPGPGSAVPVRKTPFVPGKVKPKKFGGGSGKRDDLGFPFKKKPKPGGGDGPPGGGKKRPGKKR